MKGFMNFSTLENAKECAKIISESRACPESYRGKPNDIMVCVQYGAEIGLSAIQSVYSVSFTEKGLPILPAKTLSAICSAHSSVEYIDLKYDSVNDEATYILKRKVNKNEQVTTYSKKDAEAAGLLSKSTYKLHLKDMLIAKVISRALNNGAADIIKGFIVEEEYDDYPEEVKGSADPQKQLSHTEVLDRETGEIKNLSQDIYKDINYQLRLETLFNQMDETGTKKKEYFKKANINSFSDLSVEKSLELIKFLENKLGEKNGEV